MVVVGAGPAGLSLALLLARGGVHVTLVDPGSGRGEAPRGDALMPSGLEALERLGLGVGLDALPRRELRAWSFLLQGRSLFSVPEPIWGDVACTLIDSEALLALMLQEASCHSCFRLLRGSAADLLLEPTDGGIELGSGPRGGEKRVVGVSLEDGTRLAADLVVGCDGRGSLIRRRAGLALHQEDRAVQVGWFAIEGAAALPLQRWLADRFVTLLGEGGSLALFVTARGEVRVGSLGREGEEAPASWPDRWARSSPDDLAALWRALPVESLRGPLRLSVRPGLAPRWERPGLLLLGDAAHPMSPVRAQGLNMALRDAVLAAELLLPALRDAEGTAGEGEGEDGRRGRLRRLDATAGRLAALRQAEIRAVQGLQRQELARGERLRDTAWLRRLLAASAAWSGPLLARRWLDGQPVLRRGLPWP